MCSRTWRSLPVLGVPDPRGAVVAAAGQQLPVRAESERANPVLGQMPDHAAGARADDRRGRGLPGPRRDGKDLSGRIEDGCKHPASELDGLRARFGEVEEADVGAARDEQRRPVERQRGDRRGRVDLVKGRAAPDPPDHDAAVERTRCEEPAVRAPGRLGQLMLPRQRLDQATGAVVEAHMPVAAGDEEPIAVRGERREDDVAAEAQDSRLAHRSEARAEDVGGLPSGGELRSLQRELDADLRDWSGCPRAHGRRARRHGHAAPACARRSAGRGHIQPRRRPRPGRQGSRR